MSEPRVPFPICGWPGRAILAALALITAPSARAQAPAPARTDSAAAEKTGNTRRFEEFERAARSYSLVLESKPPVKLQIGKEAALRWTNPLRKTSDGAVFLWLADGRPEAVASFYEYRWEGEILVDHEFQSLATTGLTAERDGRVVWAPATPGVVLAPIPGAPKPAFAPNERLRQMRALAREFKAFFDGEDDH
jgi:hypothetical protein